MSLSDFATATAVAQIEPGTCQAVLSPEWRTFGPAGGYQAAIALRAAGTAAKITRPASMHCHFLRVANFGPVDITVEVLHAGRSSESLRVSMFQGGKRTLEAMVRTAADGPGLAHVEGEPPQVPDPEALRGLPEITPGAPVAGFMAHLDMRVVDESRIIERDRARAAEQLDWYRFGPAADYTDPWLDAARMAMLIDTMTYSPAMGPHPEPAFVAPSIECSVWFHQPAPDCEWLLADHIAPIATGGLMGVHGKVWSRDRQLLASGGAQLLCAPRPGA